MPGWVAPTGRVVGALGFVSFLAGWQLGWVEFFAFSAGCGLLLLLGIPFVVGRASITITRQLKNRLTPVGEPAPVDLRVTNSSRRPTRSRLITETINGQRVHFAATALSAGAHQDFVVDPPTHRRSVVELGPARVTKTDPLGLFNRSLGQTEVDRLYVHPRTTALVPLAGGFAKDLEGATSDSSPVGDVAFHTIRPYQHGDDYRHVHWMSTARAGDLMVRHYVDNRLPSMLVVVDDEATIAESAFDVGLEIAASLVESGRRHYPCALYVGGLGVIGAAIPATTDELLETLSAAEQAHVDRLTETVASAVDAEAQTSVVLLISGRADAAPLLSAIERHRRRMTVVLVLTSENPPAVPKAGVKVITAPSLDTFADAWTRVVR